ncbi:MAG: Rrf2 family transcriptional regulator [Angelakisella sp.]
MHITLEADYAVRIVQCLARAQKRMDAKKIAEDTGVTLRFSLKILGKLVAGELVKSFKGTKGGYELARSADEISMADAIAAVEGKYALSRCCCETQDYQCSHNETCDCKFHHVFSEISQLVQERLEAVKFSELI